MHDPHALRMVARTCLSLAGLARAAGYLEIARRCVDQAVTIIVALASRPPDKPGALGRGAGSHKRPLAELRREVQRACARASFAFARGRERAGRQLIERSARLILIIRDRLLDEMWLAGDQQRELGAVTSPCESVDDRASKFDA
jgi:hypothetical protein